MILFILLFVILFVFGILIILICEMQEEIINLQDKLDDNIRLQTQTLIKLGKELKREDKYERKKKRKKIKTKTMV